MPSQKRVLTPGQLALSEARKKKRAEAEAAAAASKASASDPATPSILQRAFLSKRTPNLRASPYQVTIMSWNVGRTLCFADMPYLMLPHRKPLLLHEDACAMSCS